MFNILFAFVLVQIAADPFAAVEKALKNGEAAMRERNAAFSALRSAVNRNSSADVLTAQVRYQQALTAASRIGLEAGRLLARTARLELSAAQKKRYTALLAQVNAFIDNPPQYEEVMRQARAVLAEGKGGPREPVIRKPKQ